MECIIAFVLLLFVIGVMVVVIVETTPVPPTIEPTFQQMERLNQEALQEIQTASMEYVTSATEFLQNREVPVESEEING